MGCLYNLYQKEFEVFEDMYDAYAGINSEVFALALKKKVQETLSEFSAVREIETCQYTSHCSYRVYVARLGNRIGGILIALDEMKRVTHDEFESAKIEVVRLKESEQYCSASDSSEGGEMAEMSLASQDAYEMFMDGM
jgi:hypothetical protein